MRALFQFFRRYLIGACSVYGVGSVKALEGIDLLRECSLNYSNKYRMEEFNFCSYFHFKGINTIFAGSINTDISGPAVFYSNWCIQVKISFEKY